MWHSSPPEGRGTRLEHTHTPEIMTPAVGLAGGRSGFESRQRQLKPVVSDWSLSLASFPPLTGGTREQPGSVLMIWTTEVMCKSVQLGAWAQKWL